MSQSTAGKGPGIVLRTSQSAGVVRLAEARRGSASLEVLDQHGGLATLQLSADELRVVARALLQMENALRNEGAADEVTVSGEPPGLRR